MLLFLLLFFIIIIHIFMVMMIRTKLSIITVLYSYTVKKVYTKSYKLQNVWVI